MNILELISKLEVIYSQQGNIGVVVMQYDCGVYIPLDVEEDISVSYFSGKPFVKLYGGY